MATKTRARHTTRQVAHKLPRTVKQQLGRIYSQSVNKVKKHPYQAATSALLSIGAATAGTYFLLRYLKK